MYPTGGSHSASTSHSNTRKNDLIATSRNRSTRRLDDVPPSWAATVETPARSDMHWPPAVRRTEDDSGTPYHCIDALMFDRYRPLAMLAGTSYCE